MEYYDFSHLAVQKERADLRGSLTEDRLFIRFQFFKSFQFRPVRNGPFTIESTELVGEGDFRVKYSHLKKKLSDSYDSDMYYETLFSEALEDLGVPKDEHPAAVHTLFRAVEEVVDPEMPVFLGSFDCIVVEGDDILDPDTPNWIPASRAFIQGLKKVTLGT